MTTWARRAGRGIYCVVLTAGFAGAAMAQQAAVPATASDRLAGKEGDRSAGYFHYGLAHIYEDMATTQGRSDFATQAVEEYKLALAADPDSATLEDGLADLYFRLGRIREAVQVAQEQVKKNPKDAQAHELLGRVYFHSLGEMQNASQGQMLALATAEYETLVQLKPDSVEYHLLLGQLYEIGHNSAKAEVEFKRAQDLDPNSEDAVLSMVRLYSEQGDMQRVVMVLTAVPVTERSSRIEYALGVTYDQLKKPKEAAAAYQRALDIESDNLDAQRGLANALLTDGELDKALAQYQSIVKAEPQDAQSYVRIAEIQRRQGHYDQALATLTQAKTIVPDSQELIFNQALTYDALGRYDDAAKTLKDVLTSSVKADGSYNDSEKNNRGIFLERLAWVYREQGKTDDAVATYAQMAALGGDYQSRGYQGEVDAYRDAHLIDKATEVAADAAKAMPKDRGVQRLYGGQLADSGKADEGLAMVKAQLNGKPEDRETQLALAQIYIRLRRWADATAALEKADALSPKPEDKVYVDFMRANLADKQKRPEEAEAELRKVLAVEPQNTSALNYLGYMLADRGVRLPEAVSLVKKAVELDPQNGSYLDSLGWAYYKQGQYAQAEDMLTQAASRMPFEATIRYHLGEVYAKTGRLKLAVAQWEHAVAEYAKTPSADLDSEEVARAKRNLDTARVRLAKVREGHTTP